MGFLGDEPKPGEGDLVFSFLGFYGMLGLVVIMAIMAVGLNGKGDCNGHHVKKTVWTHNHNHDANPSGDSVLLLPEVAKP